MGKRSGFLLATALLLVMGTLYWMPVQATEDKPVATRLLEAVENSGAAEVTMQVRIRTAIGPVQSPGEIKQVAEEWAKQLEIPDSQAAYSRKNNILVYHTTFTKDGVHVGYEVTGVPKNGSFDAYVVLQLLGNRQSLLYMEKMQETFAKALRKAEFIPQISTCIRGMYNVKMGVDQQEGKILSIFQTLQAEEIERLQDETVVSISGYTRMWDPFIAVNGQKMNLQVATHRDSDAGTRITVGTPIITVEY